MRAISLFSGIEALSVAARGLDWQVVAFAEIEPFPCALLDYYYKCGRPLRMPDPKTATTPKEAKRRRGLIRVLDKIQWSEGGEARNWGDAAQVHGEELPDAEWIVAGPPCQDYSVAGKRAGIEGDKGNMTLQMTRIFHEYNANHANHPANLLFENVPGLLSDRHNAFGLFLAELAGEDTPLAPPGGKWTDAGYVSGPRCAIAWRVLDSQYFALAQRRRRVFVVAGSGDVDPAEILFEFDGVRGNPAARGKTQARVAGTLKSCSGDRGANSSGVDVNGFLQVTQALPCRLGSGGPDDNKAQGGFYVTAAYGGGNTGGEIPVATALTAHGNRLDFEKETFVAHTLRGEGYDASEDGTGRQNLTVVPLQEVGKRTGASTNDPRAGIGIGKPGDPMFTLQSGAQHAVACCGADQPPRCGELAESEDGTGGEGLVYCREVAPTLTGNYGRQPDNSDTGLGPDVIAFHGAQDPDVSGSVTHPCGRNGGRETCIAQFADLSLPLRAQSQSAHGESLETYITAEPRPQDTDALSGAGHARPEADAPGPCLAFTERTRCGGRALEMQEDLAYALQNPASGGGTHSRRLLHRSAVRRLTPREAERLQGFPDDYTLIPYARRAAKKIDAEWLEYLTRGGRVSAADCLRAAKDSPRYKAIGNSKSTTVLRWILLRIERFHFRQQKDCPVWCLCSSVNTPLLHGTEECFAAQMRYAADYRTSNPVKDNNSVSKNSAI